MIKIPLKLASEANCTQHWTKKRKRHLDQKFFATAFIKTLPKKEIPIPCKITLTRHAPRFFDSDNLQSAFKYIRDALSEYILDCEIAGRADNDERIQWIYDQKKTVNKEHFISIEILPL